MNNIILELREKDSFTTKYADGDYSCNLSKPILIENNDRIMLSSAFVDTTEISTQYIHITEPTTINMSFWTYNINWYGWQKCYGRQFAQALSSANLAQGRISKQDGDPYFLTEVMIETTYAEIIEGIRFYPINSQTAWGDCHAVFKYIKPVINPAPPYAPIIVPLIYNEISVYIPPQSLDTTEYIYECSFVALVQKAADQPRMGAILEIDETLTSKPLSAFNTYFKGENGVVMANYNTLPTKASGGKQVFLVPKMNQVSVTIPANKYLPTTLCNLINEAVVNFNLNNGIGIPVGDAGAPPTAGSQAIPVNPEPFGIQDITFGNSLGMPTFTQSNYFPQTAGPSYNKDGSEVELNTGTDVKNGDMFMANYHPYELDIIAGKGIKGAAQVFNYITTFANAGTSNASCGGPGTQEVGTGIPTSFIGSSQFALEFNENNLFEFRYLHTPLYVGGTAANTQPSDICNYRIQMIENNAWFATPRSNCTPKSGNGAYGGQGPIGFGFMNQADTVEAVPADHAQPLNKYVGSNGGICFASLTPHSFWVDKLGFSVKEMKQDITTGEITQKGILSHYQFKSMGAPWNIGYGNPPKPTEWFDAIIMNNFKNSQNLMASSAGLGGGGNAGMSPIMPMFPFLYGVNATSGISNIDSTIQKKSVFWWQPVTGVFDPTNNDNEGNWLEPAQTIIGDETTPIRAEKSQLLNLLDGGYYLIDIDTKLQNEMISSDSNTTTIQGIVNRYYSQNSYTSSDGSNISYTHRGQPMLLSSVGVRILNPDHTLASVGGDSTVFIMVQKQQGEDETSTDVIKARMAQQKKN